MTHISNRDRQGIRYMVESIKASNKFSLTLILYPTTIILQYLQIFINLV